MGVFSSGREGLIYGCIFLGGIFLGGGVFFGGCFQRGLFTSGVFSGDIGGGGCRHRGGGLKALNHENKHP